jgi:isocitrate lyase
VCQWLVKPASRQAGWLDSGGAYPGPLGRRAWWLLRHEDFVPALGALTGNQAVQQVQAGLKAIYLSEWQVAADASHAGHMYPDQSLYPADAVPNVAPGY